MKLIIQLIFILFVHSTFAQVKLDSNKTAQENYKDYFHPAYIYGNIIPSSLEESVIILMHDSVRYLSRAEKCILKRECLSDLKRKWGLSRESVLTIYFNRINVYDSKTMESIIFELFYQYLTTGKYDEELIVEDNLLRNKKREKKARKSY